MIECCSGTGTVSDDDDDDDEDHDDDEEAEEDADDDDKHLTMLFRDSTTNGVRDNGASTLLKRFYQQAFTEKIFLSSHMQMYSRIQRPTCTVEQTSSWAV